MKTTYLSFLFCFFLVSGFSQDQKKAIVENFIENFNKKDSTAVFEVLHKNFTEYWQKLVVNEDKKDYSKFFSWAKEMQENEEIEIVSVKGNKVVVNSTYYSDLDRLLGKLPYKCKKTFVLSNNGKIIKIISDKHKSYDYYQNKRKSSYISFKNWLRSTHGLKRQDFSLNLEDAKKMKSILLEYISEVDVAKL